MRCIMNFKIVTLIFLTLLMLSLACVSAADDVNETLTQNTDSPVLEESWNWSMEVDDEIEIIPQKNEEINIKNLPFSYDDKDNNFSLSIDDEDVKVDYFWSGVRFDASNLTYGSHKYELKFLGNNFYKPTSKIGILNVTPVRASIIENIYVPLSDDIGYLIDVRFQENLTGLLSIYIDDKLRDSANITADSYRFYSFHTNLYWDLLKVGNHPVRIVFNDTGNVFEKSKTIKVDYFLNYSHDFYYGDVKLYITAPSNLQNIPQVKVNGVSYKVNTEYDDDENKYYYITFNSVLNVGDYPIEISYGGDSRFPAKTVKDILSVRGHINIHYWSPWADIKLPKNANGNMVVDIYDYSGKIIKTVKQKVSNGQATIKFSKTGVYGIFPYVVVRYDGSDYKVENAIMKDIPIGPDIKIPESMIVGEKKYITLDLPGKEGKLMVTAHAAKYKKYTVNLVNGKASISLANWAAGKYSISITFNEKLSNGSTQKYFDHYDMIILDHINIMNPDSIYYGSAKIKLQCYGEKGKVLANKYLTVKVNGKALKKIKTNKKGVAYIKLSKKYTPKNYKITVTYMKYKITQKVKVKQVLSFDKITVKKSAKKLVFNVNLKKSTTPIKGKKITVKFNGKTIKVKTNKKGVAKVSVKKSVLKKLKVGKKVTVKATYLKTSITKKVKVQK